jgi:hypothetical protein
MLSTVRFLVLLAALGSLPEGLFAQVSDPFIAQPVFSGWANQALREEIPWKTRVASGGLTPYQRIVARCDVFIDGRYIRQHPQKRSLVALLQITDSAGRAYQGHSIMDLDGDRPDMRGGAFFSWRLFTLPGDYEVALALYDPVVGTRSFTKKSLHVDALNKDPLPDSWRDLPAVEFLLPPTKAPDFFFHPEVTARLRMPLVTRRPVRVEVMANLTGTGRAMVSHASYNFNLTSLLPILKTFSQIEVRNGSLNIEVLDLVRRQVAFRQEDAKALDWSRLSAAVTTADPAKVDFHALQDSRHMAAFLRREVAARIEAETQEGSTPPVLVLIGSSAFFNTLDDINDTALSHECGCLVYYIHYNAAAMRYRLSAADSDNVKKVLKPLQVKVYFAESPQDLRRIMAEIIDDISKL